MLARVLLIALGSVGAYRIGTESLAALDNALKNDDELKATESRKCTSSQVTFENMQMTLERKIKKGRSATEPRMLWHAIRAARNLKIGQRSECAWVAERGAANSTPTMTSYLEAELTKVPCAKQGRQFLDEGEFVLAFYAFMAEEDAACDSIEEQVHPYLRQAQLDETALKDVDDEATELEVELASEDTVGSALLELGSGELLEQGLLFVIVILAILFSPIVVTASLCYFIITAILCLFRSSSFEGCMRDYWSFPGSGIVDYH
jgi:hypothetical protein